MPRSWSPCGQQPEREAGAALSGEHGQRFPGFSREWAAAREGQGEGEPAGVSCPGPLLPHATGDCSDPGAGDGAWRRGVRPARPPLPRAGRQGGARASPRWALGRSPARCLEDAVSVSPGPHRAARGSGWHQAGEPGEVPALDTAGHRGGPGQEEWQELSRGLATRDTGAS